MSDLDQTLAALADPTRRGVIDLLRRKPRRAGELADALAMSPPAMSRHLRDAYGTAVMVSYDRILNHDSQLILLRQGQ